MKRNGNVTKRRNYMPLCADLPAIRFGTAMESHKAFLKRHEHHATLSDTNKDMEDRASWRNWVDQNY